MPGPDAYPEMILATAQDEIEALARARARQEARRTRDSRVHLASWWRRRTARRSQRG